MKKNFSVWVMSVTLTIGLVLNACGGQTIATEMAESPVVIDATNLELTMKAPRQILLAENLLTLNPELISKIEPISGDTITAAQLDQPGANGLIRFADVDLSAVQFTPGQIIVTDVTEEIPFGLLRKVVEVNPTGDNMVDLVTVQATIEEAIPDGWFEADYSEIASLLDQTANQYGGGKLMKAASAPMSLAPIEFPVNEVLYDDGHGGLVTAIGNIEVTPDFDLFVKTSGGSMEYFKFENKTTVKSKITITSGIQYSDSIVKNVYEKILPTIKIPVASTGLVIPLTPRLVVSVGLNGKVSTGISFGAEYNNTITASAIWQNSWDVIRVTDPNIQLFPPAFKTKVSAKVFARPRLELMLFGVVGPYAQVDGYYKLDASPEDNPWWTLKAGVDGEIGVSFELFGFVKLNPFHKSFEIYSAVIAQAPVEAPPEPAPARETTVQIVSVGCGPGLSLNVHVRSFNSAGINSYSIWSTWGGGGEITQTFSAPLPQEIDETLVFTHAIYDNVDRVHQIGLQVITPDNPNGYFTYADEPNGRCPGHYQPSASVNPTATLPVPPPPAGGDTVMLVYDTISANLINISQRNISVADIEFRRINDQGIATASFDSNDWRNVASQGKFDALPPNDCLMINTQRSSRPAKCTSSWGFITTSQTQYHFWMATSDSIQFQVWKDGTLLQTCQISAGSCYFVLPQP